MTTWHAPPTALDRFARHPELLDDATASSVEQHLIACADCRAVVAATMLPVELSDSWTAVVDVIDQPRPSVIERLLVRLGMPSDIARVVGATSGLRLAWFSAIVVIAAAAILVGRESSSDAPFLVLAPLAPLGSILLLFLPAEEPGGEAAAATPLFGAGILLRRAVAALAPTFAILVAAGIALPDLDDGTRWLLPALALALGSLLLATFIRPVVAIATLGVAWISVVTALRVLEGRDIPVAEIAVFELPGQLVALSVTLVAATLAYLRRDRFSTVEVTW